MSYGEPDPWRLVPLYSINSVVWVSSSNFANFPITSSFFWPMRNLFVKSGVSLPFQSPSSTSWPSHMTHLLGGSLVLSRGTQATIVPGTGSKKGIEKVCETVYYTYSRGIIEPEDESSARAKGNDKSRDMQSPEVPPGPVVFCIINSLLFLDIFWRCWKRYNDRSKTVTTYHWCFTFQYVKAWTRICFNRVNCEIPAWSGKILLSVKSVNTHF